MFLCSNTNSLPLIIIITNRVIQKVHQSIGRHSDGNMEAPALQLVKYICKVTMVICSM